MGALHEGFILYYYHVTTSVKYLGSGGVGQFACCRWGVRGERQTQMVTAAAAVGNGGGRGGGVLDSAHDQSPGAQLAAGVLGVDAAGFGAGGGFPAAAAAVEVVGATWTSLK